MRSTHRGGHVSGPIRQALCVLPLLLATAASATVDLAGKWRYPGGSIVTLTQVGDNLTIPRTDHDLHGTVTAPGHFPMSSGTVPPNCVELADMRLLPGEQVLDGGSRYGCGGSPPLTTFRITLTRCTCDDGNAVDGDGCDATCRVEPCFTCTGDPSVCAPSADGAPCDDRSTCTANETCNAGVCSGAAIPGCIAFAGAWHYRSVVDLPLEFEEDVVVEQRDAVVILANPDGVRWVGTVDPVSGALELEAPAPHLFCTEPSRVTGSVGAGVFAASGMTWTPTLTDCLGFSLSIDGTSLCGNGTIDAGESCDDGGIAPGDGCSARCAPEPCWSCSGSPSGCAPLTGTTCNDGDACTTSDACVAGVCSPGPPAACDACFSCDPSLGCVEAPRSDCRVLAQPQRDGRLQIRDGDGGSRDTIKWLWSKGPETTLAELGDPTDTNDVAFCLFDESAAAPSILFRATAPLGAAWRPTSRGYVYRDPTLGGDGLGGIQMVGGAAGQSRMLVRGKGSTLGGRAFGLPAPPLALPLRAQLQVEGGACFETRHDASGVRRNQPGSFRAAAVP